MVTIVVDDYDAAISHYCGQLGFTLTEDTRLSEVKRWVVVTPGAGGCAVLLARAATDEQAAAIGNQTGGRVGFFLYTDDFDAEYARLAACGVDFTESIRHEEFGRVVVFRDRYGNLWDFIERAVS